MNVQSADKFVVVRIPGRDDFLSAEERAALTPQIVLERCRALIPMLREDAAEAEMLRAPTPRVWSAIRNTGCFYLLIPKKFGGLEAGYDEVFDCMLALSEGDASAGWLASLTVLGNRNLTNFPLAAQEAVYGGGRYAVQGGGPAPIGKAVPVEGGYRVTGHWHWGTCSVLADWIQVFCMVEGAERPTLGSFLTPAANGKILDTWHTIGARATATHQVKLDNVFIPEHMVNFHIVRDGVGPGAELYPNPIYRAPLPPLLAFTVAVPVLGCAKAVVHFYEQHLTRHAKRGISSKELDNQPAQIRLGMADSRVRAASLILRDAIRQNIASADVADDEKIKVRSALMAQIAYAVQICREAVIMICESTGTSIHYLDHPLQRCFRDIMVMSSHAIYDHDTSMEQHGRARLGLPASSMLV